MEFGLLSLVPAAVTIIVALLTRRVALALFLGIVGGAFVLADYGLWEWAKLMVHYLWVSFSDPERLKIVLFIMLIGGLLEVLSQVGGYQRFAEWVSRGINNPRKSRLASWGLSMCLFFDDYANVLLSGGSMRNINIRNRVSPAMLAYMVDVIAIMASIMIVSTWSSFEGSTMVEAGASVGINKPMSVFFMESLPFHFYTFFAITLTLFVAYSGRWFGYRFDTEPIAEATKAQEQNISPNVKVKHVLVPILTLLGFAVSMLFIVGTYVLHTKGEAITLINILGSAPSIDILVVGSLIALSLAYYLLRKDKVAEKKQLASSFYNGISSMFGVGLVILFATGLSAVSDKLATGSYLTSLLSGFVTPEVLPVLIFLIAAAITVATGFSWSSMAIVMPIAYQMALANGLEHAIPAISAAVITGAVSGEHMIPYSEKAVMSSAACKISPVYHVKTMYWQTLSAFGAAALGFYLFGIGSSPWLYYLAPIGLMVLLHLIFARPNQEEILFGANKSEQ